MAKALNMICIFCFVVVIFASIYCLLYFSQQSQIGLFLVYQISSLCFDEQKHVWVWKVKGFDKCLQIYFNILSFKSPFFNSFMSCIIMINSYLSCLEPYKQVTKSVENVPVCSPSLTMFQTSYLKFVQTWQTPLLKHLSDALCFDPHMSAFML